MDVLDSTFHNTKRTFIKQYAILTFFCNALFLKLGLIVLLIIY